MNTTPDTPKRLPLDFDALQLQADLARVAQRDWQGHFNTAIYEGDWSGAPLRAVPGSHNAIYSDPSADNWQDTALLERCGYFQEALRQFACPLLSVRLLRLAPGAVIKEHRDYGLGLDVGEVRLHLVVSTNPQVESRINGVPYHWAAGECWYADFGSPHFFANRGDTERVHIVLDCKVNDWLLGLLAKAETCSPIADLPSASLDWLFAEIQNQPELQARLLAIPDANDLLSAISTLANSKGRRVDTDHLRAIMRQNQRAWFERHLP